jgi:hypothetical protein
MASPKNQRAWFLGEVYKRWQLLTCTTMTAEAAHACNEQEECPDDLCVSAFLYFRFPLAENFASILMNNRHHLFEVFRTRLRL